METGVLLVEVALGLAVVAVGSLLRHRARRRSEALTVVADRLALTREDQVSAATGVVGGQPVVVQAITHRRIQGDELEASVRVGLEPPLDLGLRVRRVGALGPGWGNVPVQRRAFRESFRVDADEPDRAVALLTPHLQEAIQKAARRQVDVDIRDGEVLLAGSTRDPRPADWLERLVRAGAVIASTIDQGRRAVPPAGAVRGQLAAFAELSRTLQLDLSQAPLCLVGTNGAGALRLLAQRSTSSRPGLALRLQFETPLGMPLRVRSRAAPWPGPVPEGMRETWLAEGALREALSVEVTDADWLLGIFDSDVEARLVELQEGALVEILEDSLEVRFPTLVEDPTALRQWVSGWLSLAMRLQDNAQGACRVSEGPYR